jgi:hypothetical protein
MARDHEDLGRDSDYCDGLESERPTCAWCGEELDHARFWPYCCLTCAIDAEHDWRDE